MKIAVAIAATLSAAPLGAAVSAGEPLPGIASQETTISSTIMGFERGHGDILFVRDAADRWYRVELNDGCLRGTVPLRRILFRIQAGSQRIDRFTKVDLPQDLRTCAIESIRRSAAPPQVDSHSAVTLD
jgi:hypothetical protein